MLHGREAEVDGLQAGKLQDISKKVKRCLSEAHMEFRVATAIFQFCWNVAAIVPDLKLHSKTDDIRRH